MYNVTAYTIYLSLSILTVFVVGNKLHREGKIYLFGECPDKTLAYSSNNFLYLCYCLLNSAFALFFLKNAPAMQNIQDVIEFTVKSQGTILFTLGTLHFFNLLFVPRIINHYLKKKILTKTGANPSA